jgi:glucose dehydrogenase
VHHDIWDYDAASPVVLFATVVDGEPRKGIAEAGKTGWVYILDRTNGKSLIGIDERPVPQEPRQKTAKTQPYPQGDATVPQCADPLPDIKAGCIFQPFWEEPVALQPSGQGGTNWSPMPYSPDTGYFYVPGRFAPACLNGSPGSTDPVIFTRAGRRKRLSRHPSPAPLLRSTVRQTVSYGSSKCLIAWVAAAAPQ